MSMVISHQFTNLARLGRVLGYQYLGQQPGGKQPLSMTGNAAGKHVHLPQ